MESEKLFAAAKRYVEGVPEPLRVSIKRHGARAHQIGSASSGDGRGSGMRPSFAQGSDCAPSQGVVHVKDGKPVTALGRKLMEGAC